MADRLFQRLVVAADAGLPCPSNSVLAEDLGVMRDADIVHQLMLLQERRRIFIHRGNSRRIIEIIATGRRTAVTETPRPYREFDTTFNGPIPEHQRVNRDACPRCGVRSDIGCGHGAVRLGVRMGL